MEVYGRHLLEVTIMKHVYKWALNINMTVKQNRNVIIGIYGKQMAWEGFWYLS